MFISVEGFKDSLGSLKALPDQQDEIRHDVNRNLSCRLNCNANCI